MPDILKIKGKLTYNPKREKLKKTRTNDEFFLVLDLPDNIGHYYRYWVFKRFGIKLAPPAYGCHITILDGRQPVSPAFLDKWKKYDSKIVEIEYSPEIYKTWLFWCLPIKSDFLQTVRNELGFPNKELHLTIGREDSK